MKEFNNHITSFIVMIIVGMLFNPMNILAYRLNDIYVSLTLFYGGLLMASNMIWTHEIIHYINMRHFNIYIFSIGIVLSIIISMILRSQLYVDDKNWLRRMISHHSTALTTTHKILHKTKNDTLKKLADDIIHTQENEIHIMKSILHD